MTGLTRFIDDLKIPVIIFGFGDCTGGAQASFVTHPLVHTYYFSGTNMPFAGQIVVPSHLPTTSTLSNYLATVEGSMQGLVKHPFASTLDEDLRVIDSSIPLPVKSVGEVVSEVLEESGDYLPQAPNLLINNQQVKNREVGDSRKISRILIHARGCTAAKLIKICQDLEKEIILVQSDPDMDSINVDNLTERDRVVCIGGNTSDESYLNGLSVVQVADREQVDALHPGIGFLSENSQFAELCENHGIQFIGPSVNSMEVMGNKSNAISAALKLKVPVVPGSHGILTSSSAALSLAIQD